ncbi:tripartite tricarboxylate transporter substrate binding protein [Alcaligenaceae bacterium]|nr:tripartite tricarboxylate transporter substrate binding protein [Alcaligenaceae bacterium]
MLKKLNVCKHASTMLACLPLLACYTGAVASTDFPNKPVTIIVTYPPGGSTDAITRLLGNALSKKWGQAVVVENKGGASGIIGSAAAARSKPDGYTLVMNASGPQAINVSLFKELSYDPVQDFSPIIQTTTLPLLMVTTTSSPFSTVPEFIEWAEANKGQVNYCSIGGGSPSHLAGELFQSNANIKMTHVPYKGSGPALVDTIGGVCHVLFDSALSAGPHVASGKLKLIAVGTESRLDAWPQTPAIAETLPGFSAYTWTALLAPAGTPQDIIQKINLDTAEVLTDASIAEKLKVQGALPGEGSPEELASFIKIEINKWAQVIKEGNIAIN